MGKYKRKLGSRPYQNYSIKSMNEAIMLIENNRMTVVGASRLFKIPKRTLYRKLKNKDSIDKANLTKCGSPTVFTKEEEQSFAQHLMLLAEFNMPITRDDLKMCVNNYLTVSGRNICKFKNNIPGKDWVYYFLERHPEISRRTAGNIKLARASVTEDTLTEYINNLRTTLMNVPVENIYNFDETNITDNPGKKEILVKRGTRYPELILNESKTSTSIMMCGTATGEMLPVYVVYKSGRVWTTWTEGGPDNAKYDCSTSGWFDGVTFENWFMRVLLPSIKQKQGPKVVICDNLASHINEHVIAKCRKHDIKFVFLPANTTHITQPLDVAFFGPMKKKWRKLLSAWKLTADGRRNATLPKSEFPRLLKQLLLSLEPTAEENLLSGFKACGIVPTSVKPLLDRLSKKENLNLDKVGAGFIQFVEEKREQIANASTPRKRKATNIVAGRNFWSDDSSDEENVDSPPSVNDSSEGEEENPSEGEESEQEKESDSEASLENEQPAPAKQNFNPKVGDFVLTEFMSEQNITVEYVGVIEEILPRNEFTINFLKQYNNRKSEFCFPNVKCYETVLDDNIISILPAPEVKRGKYKFPYDIIPR